jgi:hypothetical protein
MADLDDALQMLVGQPVVETHRAVDMQMFSFGELSETGDRRGMPRTTSQFALHIQCPWRIVCAGQVLVGYQDLRYPRAGEPDSERFDPDRPHTTLRDELLETFFSSRGDKERVVIEANATDTGDLRLSFSGGCVLQAFPDSAAHGREYWRVFEVDGEHFVAERA